MPVYQEELKRLILIKALIKSNFTYFGINKRQELTRLFYEISKRENLPPLDILNAAFLNSNSNKRNFSAIKKYLLARRYHSSLRPNHSFLPYLPKIELGADWFANLKKRKFYPKRIFIEDKAAQSYLVVRFRSLFSKAEFHRITSLKDYRRSHPRFTPQPFEPRSFKADAGFTIPDYNQRQDTIFIVNETYDFFKSCPCTRQAFRCDYHIFNLGFGCVFECSYCYLQGYTNIPGIILPANIEDFLDNFKTYKKTGMRVGTGEFSDSLALDEITNFSVSITEFFSKQKNLTFEFKTKSACVKNLFKVKPSRNVVISWSLNPQDIINDNEFFTASLNERLKAAERCATYGYPVGFHFDPVIYFKGWAKDYRLLIDSLFNKIRPRQIAWISIGTFRFSPHLKPVVEKRFPCNKILDEELLLGFDNKLRYPYVLRYDIYKTMIEMLRRHDKRLKLYLCMEEIDMWRDLNLKMPDLRCRQRNSR